MEKNKVFNYTYSAKEQEEIKAIRQKYTETETADKMALLRRLDAGVTKKATKASLILGVVGALVMGFGMSLVMSDLGSYLGMQELHSTLVGVATGIVGIIPVSLAYPVYKRIVKKERKKIAPEILRLTDELMK